MKNYDKIIQELQEEMQEKPSANLRNKILNSAEQGIKPPKARMRIKSYPILLVALIVLFSTTAIATYAVARTSNWREHLEEVLQSPRAVDEGYVTYFYPLEFYFSAEMQEQQKRIAEITIHGEEIEQHNQHIIKSLGLDISRELDQIDAALIESFSRGSVVTVRFDGTPLLVGPISSRSTDILGFLDAGTALKISSLSDTLSYLVIPMDSDIAIRAWHVVEVLYGEYAGVTGWLPNYLLKPSDYTLEDFGYDPNRWILEVTHPERGISFTMRMFFDGLSRIEDDHIPAEEMALIMADAIYDRFDFCVDGMEGYMLLLDGSWSMAILCEERTTHSMGNELFHMFVNAITGEVGGIIANTPETPTFG